MYYNPYIPYAGSSCSDCGDTRQSPKMMPATMPMAQQPMIHPMMQQPMMQPMPVGFPPQPSGGVIPGTPGVTGDGAVTAEESYIENILRFNRGKIGTFYMTFENNPEWAARVFRGRVETAGRDHIILSDPSTGRRYLLLMVNLDWVEFDEPLAYIPPQLPPQVQSQLTTREFE